MLWLLRDIKWWRNITIGVIALTIMLTAFNSLAVCHSKNFLFTFLEYFNMGGPNCSGITFSLAQLLSVSLPFIIIGFPILFGIYRLFRKIFNN